ncbi:gamma-glutamylcyclotransferase [Paenibacillus sp. P26]|nr:gamma-glutamylcyclotransferase [Paenibacillus sp. P26]
MSTFIEIKAVCYDGEKENGRYFSEEAGHDSVICLWYAAVGRSELFRRCLVRPVRTAGAVRGTLYDAGEYPALVLSGRDRDLVQGEWLIISEEGLKQTDLLEEYYGPGAERNDYERIWIRDAKREEREGWVYVWKDSRGRPAIPSGSWRRHRNPEGSGV